MNSRVTAPLLAGLLAAACASSAPPTTQEVAEALERPVDCADADKKIAILQAERSSVAEYISAGVGSMEPGAPAAQVLGLPADPEWVVPSQYAQRLETAIAGIRRICSLPIGELTDDGLAQVMESKVGFAAIRPGVDLAAYSRLIVLPVQLSFKKSRDTFELTERQKDLMRTEFHRAFVRQLEEKGDYAVVMTPAPDVLLVVPALVEIEVKVPPETTSARDRIYVSETGRFTLVAEFRDSVSGELVARVADRAKIAESSGGMYRSSSVGHIGDLRRLFDMWASLLRDSLDEAHELSSLRQAG